MPDYARLPTLHKTRIRLVVETPRGSAAKLSYEPENHLFRYSRPLPAGITYPYDWGFIPSTLGEDGDPLDGMVVHKASTPPGVIIECQLLGALSIEQIEDGEKFQNDRYLFCPIKQDAEDEEFGDGISGALKKEIEQFFQASILNTVKKLKFSGWRSAKHAHRGIKAGQKAFARREKS